MQDENYREHKEDFDVVLLKKGVNPDAAKPEDFKRVQVQADSPLSAIMADAILGEKDHHALFAAKPGILTDPEVQAYRRVVDSTAVDKSKI